MPTYEMKCDKCNIIHERVLSINCKKEDKEAPCDKCGGPVYQTFTECAGFIITENQDPVSCKTGGYWRNAEQVKQKEAKKRKSDHQEKVFYKDAETMQKVDNIRKNREAAFQDNAPDGMTPKEA